MRRIGIHTLFLHPGQVGGTETYLRELIQAISQTDTVNQYFLLVGAHNRGIWQNIAAPNFQEVLIQTNRPTWVPTNLQKAAEQSGLISAYAGQQISRLNLDIIHFPGTIIEPLSLPVPAICTVHDIQHETYPQFFSLRERVRRHRFYKASLQKAVHTIAISRFTQQEVINRYHLKPAQVRLIYSGVRHTLTNATTQNLHTKYNLPESFIYYPSKFWPHKNHHTLLQALQLLKNQQGITVNLLLSGAEKAELSAECQNFIDTNLPGQVHILGWIPYADVIELMRQATCLVYPSLYEGFGLPVLEAMSVGCPVICADTTALPEVAGNAAMMIKPNQPAEWVKALLHLLSDTATRAKLIARGRQQAAKFSWDQCAQATIALYEQASSQTTVAYV